MANVELLKDDHIATIQFNRPEKLNTLTKDMVIQLASIVQEINFDEQIRVAVIKGAGDRAFSAGSDINLLEQYGSNWQFRNRLEYCDVIRGLRKPLIAMIHGYALGGGFELALCADMRFAANTAKFGAVEIKLGWIGGGGITQLLTHLIGYGKAMKLILSGEIISAEEADKLGIIESLLPEEDLESYTYDYAHKLAQYSPIALEVAKQGCRLAMSVPIDVGIRYERDMQTICFYTDDSKEGVKAFQEKRSPNFQGR